MLKMIKLNHSAIYVTGLGIMIFSLPLSPFALSVGQFVLVGNWLLEMNFRTKIKAFLSNKPAMVLVSVYILHVAGLIYTTDLNYALKDLRIKLPLLALPIIFSTTPSVTTKTFDRLIGLFIIATISATFIGFGILMFKDIRDIREMSPFISHIRFSLIICLAIFFSGYFIIGKYYGQLKYQVLFGLIILWLMAYLIFSQSATGFYVMMGAVFCIVVWGFSRIQNKVLKRLVIIFTLLIPVILSFYLYLTVTDYLKPHKNDLKNLISHSDKGNFYTHDTLPFTVENGSYIWLYVCDTELQDGWNSISNLDYDGKDEKGQELKTTLVRYLNSKGLRKDANGLKMLDMGDIRNIEKGIANYHYAKKFSLNARIYKFLWEYQSMKQGSVGGLSLIQRFEYWKAATGIISNNFWFGVGTGDMDEAFRIQYEKMDTKMAPEFRHRSHNQFLAIFTAFGIFGLLWFIFALIYPPFKLKAFRDFRYFAFFIVITLSMLFEDTLETQIGATLFAFFNSFLLFVHKDEPSDRIPEKVVNSPSRILEYE
jgi:hypothetical protein